jgi:hypothetical protein
MKTANLQYGATQAWVYALPFIEDYLQTNLGLKKITFWVEFNDYRKCHSCY